MSYLLDSTVCVAFLRSGPNAVVRRMMKERRRFEMARDGNAIGPNDMLIASIALVHGATLITHNTREFSRVRGLQIEDWEA